MLVCEWHTKTARRDALQDFLSRQQVAARRLSPTAVKAVERDMQQLADGIGRLETLQREEETNQIMLKPKRAMLLTVQAAISCMAKICDSDKFNADKFVAAKTPEELRQVNDSLDSSFRKKRTNSSFVGTKADTAADTAAGTAVGPPGQAGQAGAQGLAQ